jgi:hypothetical protein
MFATIVFFLIAGSSMPLPNLPEQFSMSINMTTSSGEWLGIETMAFNLESGDNHIFVSGPSFSQPFGQLTVSPVSPAASWFVQYETTPWQCKNETIQMQWQPFWQMPPGTNFSGVKTIAGQSCNTWQSPGPNPDVLYLAVGTNTPVAIQLAVGSRNFFYYYLNWTPGPPPASLFTLPNGRTCPQAKKKPSAARAIAFGPKCTDRILV